jgi:hypothetical protein
LIPFRRRAGQLLLGIRDLKGGPSDPDLVTGTHCPGASDPLPVDERAVGGLEVPSDDHRCTRASQHRVAARYLGILSQEIAVLTADGNLNDSIDGSETLLKGAVDRRRRIVRVRGPFGTAFSEYELEEGGRI